VRLGFEPDKDLARDAGGCWKWSGEKAQELENWSRYYFVARQEDGDSPDTVMVQIA